MLSRLNFFKLDITRPGTFYSSRTVCLFTKAHYAVDIDRILIRINIQKVILYCYFSTNQTTKKISNFISKLLIYYGGGRGIRTHVSAQHRQNDFESYESLAFSCLRRSYEAVIEEEKILVPQAFADVLTSSVQNVLQGDQSSNKPVFLQE